MKVIRIIDLKEYESFENKEIRLMGWIRTNRSNKNIGFIELNDGTTFKNVQVVYEKTLSNFEEVEKYTISSAIDVVGKVVLTPNSKQPFEILATQIVLNADSDRDYPLQKKRHSFEYLRTIAHLRPRSNTFSAMFRIRSLASFAVHEFFRKRDFVYINTPIITASDAEGAGEMFRVTTLDLEDLPRVKEGECTGKIDYKQDFFGKETFLTVSGQLNLEPLAFAFRNVYSFGPTFRAENSNTSRHAAEFWMLEPEMAFADLNNCMDTAEAMVKHMTNYLFEHAMDELEFFDERVQPGLIARLRNLVDSEFARITYTEAVELLKNADKKFEYPVEWGMDLQSEHERYLAEEKFQKPVFVTDYPKDIKAFYMRLNDDGKTVAACDLLVPGVGELIGGSQREERYDILLQRIREFGLDEQAYSWYLDTRKYGGCYHSGYGLGFDRYLMYVTGMSNIRDTSIYPRTTKQADF